MFLNNVVENIVSKSLSYKDLYVILPNRRSALFVKEIFKRKIDSASWMPRIFAVKDFVFNYTAIEPIENIQLLLLLYTEFQKHFNKEQIPEFNDFIFLGSYILSDFDTITKELNEDEIEKLFTFIHEYKVLDSGFSFLDDNQKSVLTEFWENIEKTNDKNFIKQYFIELWQALWPIYQKINNDLSENDLGYEAMAYQTLYKKITDQPVDELPTFCFVGFNALTKIQVEIFSYLKGHNKALFYWDYDNRFDFSNSTKFLKQNIELFGNNLQDNELKNRVETIFSEYPLPSNTLQVNVLEYVLQRIDKNESTCVILNDESILVQILPVITSTLNHVNISVGVSVTQLAPVQLVQQMIDLMNSKKSDSYYYKALINLLENPFVLFLEDFQFKNEKFTKHLIQYLQKNNISYISQNQLEKFLPPLFNALFNFKNIADILTCWQAFFRSINFGYEEDQITEFYRSSVDATIELIDKTKDNLNHFTGETITLRLISKLFNLIASEVMLHFRSTNDKKESNIQVMGLLETRLLNFENIILLSANDEFFPKLNQHNSLIPFKIKKAYGLPTLENQEVIYSYTFYRLLYRAKQVHFVYSNIQDEMNTGEKSRFIYQLQYFQGIKIEEKNISFKPLPDPANKAITVAKSDEIVEKLINKELSASSLSVYLDCPLKFYFRYVKELKEPDEIQEDINAKSMGNIFHNVMAELLPQGYYTESLLKNIIKDKTRHGQLIEKYFKKEFQETNTTQLEKNGLFVYLNETIKYFINKTLQYDKKFVPFQVLGTEKKIIKPIQITINDSLVEVSLKSFIDRFDLRANDIHIIDYKTGKIKKKIFTDFETLFTKGNEHQLEHRDYIFQLFLYAYMLDEPEKKYSFYLRNYSLVSAMRNDLDTCYISGKEKLLVDDVILSQFESNLKVLIEEILDKDNLFEQQKSEKNCQYCEFYNMCW